MDDVAIEPGVDGVISVSGRMGVSLPAFPDSDDAPN
jgi:hypothetical protein